MSEYNFKTVTVGRNSGESPLTEEVSSPSLAQFGGRFDVVKPYADSLLHNRDDIVLSDRRAGLKLWERVLTDEQVHSNFQQRRLSLLSKEFEVKAGAEDKQSVMAAEFMEETLSNTDWKDICDKMLFGIFYGYAVGECLWARDGRHWTLDTVKVRKPSRFGFDRAGGLRLIRPGLAGGELMPDRKFWSFSHGADNHDNPYGVGLASKCYWATYFKRNGLRFWMLALEKFGAPTAVGKYPANATDKEKRALLDAVLAFASASGVTIQDGMDISLLGEAARVGGNHDKLYETMNASISKVLVGQTMTSDDGSSQAQANVHENMLDHITAADNGLIHESFRTGPAKWLTEWNYPNAVTPLLTRKVEAVEDLNTKAERDTKLYNMGWEPTEEHIHEVYGDGYVRRIESKMDAPGKPTADLPEFSEAGDYETATDRFVNDPDRLSEMEADVEGLIDHLSDMIEGAESLEKAKGLLPQFSAFDKTDPFYQRLGRSLFSARLHGRAVEEGEERI